MTALLQMFISNSEQAGNVHEEAMRAVTALIEVLGEKFIKYMDSFKPFLLSGLKNHSEHQVIHSFHIVQLLYLESHNYVLIYSFTLYISKGLFSFCRRCS